MIRLLNQLIIIHLDIFKKKERKITFQKVGGMLINLYHKTT